MLEPVSPGQTKQDGDGEQQGLEPMSDLEYQQRNMESAAGGIRLRDDYPLGMPRFEADLKTDSDEEEDRSSDHLEAA